MKSSVASAAFAAGAIIWNDVYGLRTPGAAETAAALGGPVIVMHMQGEPRTMQAEPQYGDVVSEVIEFLQARVGVLAKLGLDQVYVDPGIGFGKTLAHNVALLNATDRIAAETGKPVLIGASRKRFIAAIDERATDAGKDRLGGSVAAALIAAQKGAAMVRVHDVQETVQALRLWRALNPT
jgi:dihydropteroate synthase